MNCPLCDQPLKPEHEHGIEIDVCGDCWGMWFDHGELESHWRASRSSNDVPPVDPSRFRPEPGSVPLTCPRCTTSTLSVKRVDVFQGGPCSSCHGVWISPNQEGRAGERTLIRDSEMSFLSGALEVAVEIVFFAIDELS